MLQLPKVHYQLAICSTWTYASSCFAMQPEKSLWTEYMQDCRTNGEELVRYSQFCYCIQQKMQKCRATMYINCKHGEQVAVDWVGNTATIIIQDTCEIIND